jgi:hypothetical protein
MTKRRSRREQGTNPRALGLNPCSLATNPRSLGTNPRSERKRRLNAERLLIAKILQLFSPKEFPIRLGPSWFRILIRRIGLNEYIERENALHAIDGLPTWVRTLKNRLKEQGIKTYAQYLASDYWKEARRRYLESNLPKCCAICGNPKFQLHHRTYVNLGRENLCDIIPLCGKHHSTVHDKLNDSVKLRPGRSLMKVTRRYVKNQRARSAQQRKISTTRLGDSPAE